MKKGLSYCMRELIRARPKNQEARIWIAWRINAFRNVWQTVSR